MATNGYLLEDEGTTLLIDAPAGVFDWLQQKDLYPDHLLLTHQHFDHFEDAHLFEGPIHAFSPYSTELTIAELARSWGLPIEIAEYSVDQVLENQSQLELGNFSFQLLHVPGHSPDSLVYELPAAGLAFVGDTLFRQGAGRTDLPGGSAELLRSGIREKLPSLPPQTQILPGHGPATTPAAEAMTFG